APVLESMHAQLFTPPPLPAVESLGHDQPPDVIVVVLESWRWTSLSPQYMPRLDALGERGLVAKHHYSTSNRSEFGLFSLLYGRTPSLYEQTLDRSIPPVMCRIFRQWGYESVYVSGLRHAKFNRMEQYIDHPDAF